MKKLIENNMKKYKVTATPITPIIPGLESHEYVVFAEDDQEAKKKATNQWRQSRNGLRNMHGTILGT